LTSSGAVRLDIEALGVAKSFAASPI